MKVTIVIEDVPEKGTVDLGIWADDTGTYDEATESEALSMGADIVQRLQMMRGHNGIKLLRRDT